MILTFKENKCYPLNHLKNHITRPNIMAHLTLTGTHLDFLICLLYKKLSINLELALKYYIYPVIYFSVSSRRNEIEGGHHRSKFTTTTGKSVELRKPEVRKT